MSQPTEPAAFTGMVDLLAQALGGRALLCSDDFFAGMENLVAASAAIFIADKYTDRGKWMDGWESRRKRVPGHDWCILALGVPGEVRGVDIDTAHFLGNHPPFASVDAVHWPDATPDQLRDEAEWTPILAQIPLRRGSHNLAATDAARGAIWTHLRLNIFPAGGVARFRAYGLPARVEAARGDFDLAALAAGGQAVACSDMFFSPMANLLMPGRPADMGGGWETRRSRPPGEDWVIIALAQAGQISRFEVDTAHFKGNYPDRCVLEALHWPGAPPAALTRSEAWQPLTGEVRLRPDHIHQVPLADGAPTGPWTHVRMRILPDGGVARLRVIGTASTAAPGEGDPALSGLNAMMPRDVNGALERCCGSARWVAALASARPFASRTHLHGAAQTLWWRLGDGDWLAAFEHHPRIGADMDALRAKFGSTAGWASGEQAGAVGASEDVLRRLAAGNKAYEARFGFIFIVCASGLTAEEMLASLNSRMDNEPAAELRIAAGEQAKITALRLDKLLASMEPAPPQTEVGP